MFICNCIVHATGLLASYQHEAKHSGFDRSQIYQSKFFGDGIESESEFIKVLSEMQGFGYRT
jgi:hypothetical protein